ncbi:MAG: HAD hydrolase-like protein [Amaricoccus sp.]|uniref:HAD family hydrolase n=1 Tax=Amaricoccus sp. TaxID=1872485 RepID=UPI0039E339CE
MTIFTRPHVLFDLDGTLVDTRAAVLECYTRVFRERLNSDFPPDAVPKGELFAMRPAEIFSLVAPDRKDELYAAYSATYPDCIDHIAVFPGAARLIEMLVAAGRKPGLVTNKGLERTLIDLDHAGIPTASFSTIVTAEDTRERKPHPAPILLGLERAGARPEEAVYVGDGPQDVIAAHAAGLPCIGLTYGFYKADDLTPHEPEVLAGDVAALARALGVDLAEPVA